jgi:proline iminopeptidase
MDYSDLKDNAIEKRKRRGVCMIKIIIILLVLIMGGCVMNQSNEISRSGDTPEQKEGYIDVSGGKVWYQIVGINQKKTPVLIVHGGPGASHDYLESLADLADERPVIFYDQLGCGNSAKPADTSLWTLERYVEELEQVIKFLGYEKLHIIGQSWGVALAVEYVLTEKPENVVSLVLSGPLLSTFRWVEDQKDYIAGLPEDIRETILRCEEAGDFDSPDYANAMMAFYQKHLCWLDPWPESILRTFEKINLDIYQYMWGPSEFTVTGTLKDYDRTGRLGDIKIPVLFTCGRYDEASPKSTEAFHKKISGSELLILEDASHQHHLEKPEEYLSAVRNFLSRAEE